MVNLHQAAAFRDPVRDAGLTVPEEQLPPPPPTYAWAAAGSNTYVPQDWNVTTVDAIEDTEGMIPELRHAAVSMMKFFHDAGVVRLTGRELRMEAGLGDAEGDDAEEAVASNNGAGDAGNAEGDEDAQEQIVSVENEDSPEAVELRNEGIEAPVDDAQEETDVQNEDALQAIELDNQAGEAEGAECQGGTVSVENEGIQDAVELNNEAVEAEDVKVADKAAQEKKDEEYKKNHSDETGLVNAIGLLEVSDNAEDETLLGEEDTKDQDSKEDDHGKKEQKDPQNEESDQPQKDELNKKSKCKTETGEPDSDQEDGVKDEMETESLGRNSDANQDGDEQSITTLYPIPRSINADPTSGMSGNPPSATIIHQFEREAGSLFMATGSGFV